MLGVKNKAKIEKLCLILGERAVRTHNTEKILRCREMILWIVYIKTLAMEIAAVVRVSLRRDYRKASSCIDWRSIFSRLVSSGFSSYPYSDRTLVAILFIKDCDGAFIITSSVKRGGKNL